MWMVGGTLYRKIMGHNNGNNYKKFHGSFRQSYFDLPRGREVRNNMVSTSGAMER